MLKRNLIHSPIPPTHGLPNLARTFLCGEMKILHQMLEIELQSPPEPGSPGLGAAWKVQGCPQPTSAPEHPHHSRAHSWLLLEPPTARGGGSLGGIYSKGDTSFLIMCSSFLFPVHIWALFLGSQFSSVVPHMALQHHSPHSEKTLPLLRNNPQQLLKLDKEWPT